MFRAIISPILRSSRLWYTAPTMLSAGGIGGALYHKLQTRSSAPEDGQNYSMKHVEVIVIFNRIITVESSWLFILLYYNYIEELCNVHLRNGAADDFVLEDVQTLEDETTFVSKRREPIIHRCTVIPKKKNVTS